MDKTKAVAIDGLATLPQRLQLRVQDRLYEWPITSSDDRQHAHMALHQVEQS